MSKSISGSKSSNNQAMRLPQVDRILRHEALKELNTSWRPECLTQLVRQILNQLRAQLQAGASPDYGEDVIARKVLEEATRLTNGGLKRVINGTGVILNTNLGRAPLPEILLEQMGEILGGYTSLEIDLETGQRGERTTTIESLLNILTGCEAAIVVNNNAAAVMLLVSALATNKEVIVSRGELIEIGGSFRLPDVITAGGAILKEVGTTNRTRFADYEQAINASTGLMLKCHRSNFEISGFTEEATMQELSQLSKEKGVPLAEDLGSGAIIDLQEIGVRHEPTVQEGLHTGANLVLFSGDKLLGGMQAGIVVGRKDLVARLRKHPMYRALRPEKFTIALLESVLSAYLKRDLFEAIPIFQLTSTKLEELRKRAETFSDRIENELTVLTCLVVPTKSTFGGGTMPNYEIDSCGITINIKSGAPVKISAQKLSDRLRRGSPPVVSTIEKDTLAIDFRTLLEIDEERLFSVLRTLDNELKP